MRRGWGHVVTFGCLVQTVEVYCLQAHSKSHPEHEAANSGRDFSEQGEFFLIQVVNQSSPSPLLSSPAMRNDFDDHRTLRATCQRPSKTKGQGSSSQIGSCSSKSSIEWEVGEELGHE